VTAPNVAWSDAALELFRLEGASGVSAGAGTGKTTALVELLLRLLGGETPLGPCEPREVVAITFTEKAGAELTERLAAALSEAVAAAQADGNAVRAGRLAEARRNLSGMAVGTIHGFAARLIREHALEAGADPDFEVMAEDAAEEALSAAAVSAAVAALDEGGCEVRVLSAGHGGVRGLAAVSARLVRERATRGETGPVLAATGDPAAIAQCAQELESSVSELLRLGGTAATATGRSALAALSALWPGVRTRALCEPNGERLAALVDPVRGWRLGRADSAGIREARERFLAAASALPALLAEVAAAPQAKALAALVEDTEKRYAASKADACALDFDDLLLRARDLLRAAPAALRELRERTRALLVDEYQDVNGLQAEIFGMLAGPWPEGGAPAVLVAVGDAKQSIYRFRGADVSVFASLLEKLGPGGQGRVHHLRENHRSVPGVIELVNDVLRRRRASLGVAFGEEDELRAMRSGGASPAAEMLAIGDGGPAEERRGLEAAALATRIRDLVSGAAGVTVRDRGGGAPRPPRFGEVAILFRRLTAVGEYERALRLAGVPCRLARGGGFYQASEVRDLGELAASLGDPADEVAWAALLRSPLCGLSDASLFFLARGGGGKGLARFARLGPGGAVAALWAARPLAVPEGEAERLHRFLATWASLWGARGRLDVAELLARAAEELDLEAALLAGPDGERRAKNLRKALELARQAAARGTTAAAFGERLRRMARRPPREPEADLEAADAVALLSIHQAKGLEWPVAVVPDMGARPPAERRRAALDQAGRICVAPFSVPGDAFAETSSLGRLREEARAAESAESLRLLYVALTRARDYLVLSSAGRAASESWAKAIAEAPPEILRHLDVSEGTAFASPGMLGSAPDKPSPAPTRGPLAAAPDCLGAAEGAAVPPLRRPAAGEAVRQPVTALVEYARCPRRHWLSRHLRLEEPRPASAGQDDPDRATERGTLAHALLAEVDLLAPPLTRRVLLAAAASRQGYDPRGAGVRGILRDVERFLESPAGRRLAGWERAGSLRREVPFLLRLEDTASPVYLDGAIDALALEKNEVFILDFKYATPRSGAAERYRLQLLAYALAASRAWPRRTVRAALWFLRGGFAAADLTPSGSELARFSAEAPALVREAAAAKGRGASPAALHRTEARCRSERCGYVSQCFALAEASRSPPGGAPSETAASPGARFASSAPPRAI
jgi:ATP-dependent exoDNAse (exonuclease V) beta subunit